MTVVCSLKATRFLLGLEAAERYKQEEMDDLTMGKLRSESSGSSFIIYINSQLGEDALIFIILPQFQIFASYCANSQFKFKIPRMDFENLDPNPDQQAQFCSADKAFLQNMQTPYHHTPYYQVPPNTVQSPLQFSMSQPQQQYPCPQQGYLAQSSQFAVTQQSANFLNSGQNLMQMQFVQPNLLQSQFSQMLPTQQQFQQTFTGGTQDLLKPILPAHEEEDDADYVPGQQSDSSSEEEEEDENPGDIQEEEQFDDPDFNLEEYLKVRDQL